MKDSRLKELRNWLKINNLAHMSYEAAYEYAKHSSKIVPQLLDEIERLRNLLQSIQVTLSENGNDLDRTLNWRVLAISCRKTALDALSEQDEK